MKIVFNSLKKGKDHFMKYLNNNNILAQQHYIPIYKFSVYNEKINQLTGAEKYSITLLAFLYL
tara:strand:+ start:303 stop:491 length:189 start_codon:yes stop_codon:yes gene_type:complete